MSTSTARTAKRPRRKKKPKLSHVHKPEHLSLEEWQVQLRRQFGREQKFKLENLSTDPIFSDFQVTNPQSGNTYRVSIRGAGLEDNFCTCADFATNTLGTCKHIEFTLAKLARKGGKTQLKAGFQPPYSEILLRYGAERQVRFRAGTECPPGLLRAARKYFDEQGILRADAFGAFEKFLDAASTQKHQVRCYDDVLTFIAERRDQERRIATLQSAFPDGIRSQAFDGLLKAPLYDYQREGALFAARAGRALIGDEMGLGKTIQALAAAEIMAHHFGVERVLIVSPTSLKYQWLREISKFISRKAQVIGGLFPARQEGYSAESFYKITNYDTIHTDLDLIRNWSPDLVILDEAQRIKNWNTRTARAVKRLSSPYAVVLTGTPLENRLEELVSIVQFVDRHRLGPTFRFLADHQIHDAETGRVVGYKNLDTIGTTLSDVLIRRRKQQVLKQLPERLDKNLFVPMTPEQMTHHTGNKEVVARIVAKWRKFHHLTEADQRRLMIALQNMRMSCDSTYLLDHETDFGVKADELATLLEEMYEQPNTKVVIFSQWLAMHELLVRRMKKRKWEHVLFSGRVPSEQRAKLVDQFREDEKCRAFLATDAGGVGLNLQHASVVVNMDLPWNPAVLEQRIGRVHRLGQSQPVRVVNFVSQGTIEEGMLSVLQFKKSLFSGILDSGDKEVFLGGSRLKRFIDSVESATGSIPAAQTAEMPTHSEKASTSRDERSDPEDVAQSAVNQPVADPWAGLLQTGLSFLEQLASSARQQHGASVSRAASALPTIERGPSAGDNFIKIPMPSPEVLDKVLSAVGTLLERFRK